jgi:hypothetical protein
LIGNAKLSASDEVTAASLDNTGNIILKGSGANQALLDVTGSAGFGTAGVLTGVAVSLFGDSAIEFASGQITSLTGNLLLDGNDAFIEDSTALGSNSALSGLTDVAGDDFYLENGASVSTAGALVNNGLFFYIDTVRGDGGSSLTVAGALTNNDLAGSLTIGNAKLSASDRVTAASLDNTGNLNLIGSLIGSGANQALLDVTGAAGVLSGDVQLAGDSAIEFASGQITSLTSLALNGKDAFIEGSTALGSNSALTGLSSVGRLDLENGASVSTTGSLEGSITLGGDGGASLTVGGTLTVTNGDSLTIGNVSASDKVTAASLDITNYVGQLPGSIQLSGSSPHQALLDVTGAAGFGTAGALSGDVQLAGDSAIEFASGEITSLAAYARLVLNGSDAFIEDSTAVGSNSALTGLASIGAGATFDCEGALVSTTGALVNVGDVFVDGGSSLNIGGTLTNSGYLAIGDGEQLASDTVTAASLDNTGGISVYGFGANQALLDVTTGVAGFGAAGVLSGDVELYDSAIEFASGEITSLAANAQLHLNGNNAFMRTAPRSARTAL